MKRFTRHLLVATGILLSGGLSVTVQAQTQPSRAQQLMGSVAPKLAELTDGVLYGDIWERPDLSKRDRSLITHMAFYAGWPNAVTAVSVAKDVFQKP